MNEPHYENEPSSEPVIDIATSEDAEGIAYVHRMTWMNTYPNEEAGITEADIKERLEGENGEKIPKNIERWKSTIEKAGENSAVFVVRLNGKVVGFISPRTIHDQRRLGAIYVLPEAQGKGVGTKLINKALEWWGRSEDIYLHVATYNTKAFELYKKIGFEETGKDIAGEPIKFKSGAVMPEIEMVLRAEK